MRSGSTSVSAGAHHTAREGQSPEPMLRNIGEQCRGEVVDEALVRIRRRRCHEEPSTDELVPVAIIRQAVELRERPAIERIGHGHGDSRPWNAEGGCMVQRATIPRSDCHRTVRRIIPVHRRQPSVHSAVVPSQALTIVGHQVLAEIAPAGCAVQRSSPSRPGSSAKRESPRRCWR